jgi:hypothetical protein
MREAGKGVAAVLSGAGLTVAEASDPSLRLAVRTQIKVLELAAQELQDEFLGFHLARSLISARSGWHLRLDGVSRSPIRPAGERRGSLDLDQRGHLWLDQMMGWAIQQGILHAPQNR